MKKIDATQVHEWITQCDRQLKHLQNAKDCVREFYRKDEIHYITEEHLNHTFGESIAKHKAIKDFLNKILTHCATDGSSSVEFDYVFPDSILRYFTEEQRNEFMNYVYEI